MRYVYRCLVTAAALIILYAVSDVLRRGESNPSAWALLVLVGALAFSAAVAVWSRHSVAVSVQVVAIPFLAALYLFEVRQKDPVDEMLHVRQFWDLVKSGRASGQPISIQYSPTTMVHHPDAGFTLPSGMRVFPVAPGVANVRTVMCREGDRPFAEYLADEHGFNNPQGIWGRPVELVFIGDSMTYGACLPGRDHFIAQIREQHPATLNLGAGGIGPLIELAIVREFVPPTHPKYVFYLYDENNDLYFPNAPHGDLAFEDDNPILRMYVSDDRFSQDLFERRAELHELLKRYLDSVIDQALAERTPAKLLLKVLGLPLTRASLPPIKLNAWSMLAAEVSAAEPEADDVELYKAIFLKMVQTANRADAKFVFVNIPAQTTVCDNVEQPLKKQVLDFVARSGVDMIDLEQDYRDAIQAIGRDALFAVPPCGGHFSERGYKIIGDRLIQYLHTQADAPAPAR